MSVDISREKMKALREHFQRRQKEILAMTRSLVETESPSGDEEGSNKVVSLIAASARGINPITSIDRIASENYGSHLRIRAFGQPAQRVPPLVIIGHTDTVHPRGSLEARPWRVEGNRIYGPGIFDMKANCALALEALRACEAAGAKPKRPVTILLTCDEENGSPAGRGLVEAESRRARAVLVLEPPAGGRVKTARKGTGMFTISVRGRAAHAGLDPEKGVSAVLELARQTVRLHAMNDPTNGTTVTVGVVQGGTHSNVVPAEARGLIDTRFSSSEAGLWLEREILNLKPIDPRAQVIVSGGINRPPLERTEKVRALYDQAREIATMLDFDLGEASVGGASDGNFVGAMGVAVLDGLGIEGDGAHAANEHIIVDDIPFRGALLAGLIASL